MTIQANQGFGVSVFGATSAGGGGSTSPGGSSGQVQYNNGGSFGGMSGTTWTDASQSLAIASTGAGTGVTTSSPVLNLSQTWNDGAGGTVTFTGLKFNVTDTASGASSLLLDLQVGGNSLFRVNKNGTAIVPYGLLSVGYINLATSGEINFNDVFIRRAAAATLQLGAADAAAPVAQFFKVQSGTAGASATTVSISGTSLTIAGTVTGTIAIGHAVTGTGVSAGTLITAGSGTSWTVNNSQTVGPITAYFNSVGADFTIRGSQGSGPSAGGSLIFQVAPAGSAATTAQNAYSTQFQIVPSNTSTGSANTVTVAAGPKPGTVGTGLLIVNGGNVQAGSGSGHLVVTSARSDQTVFNVQNSSVASNSGSWEFGVAGSASAVGAGAFYFFNNGTGGAVNMIMHPSSACVGFGNIVTTTNLTSTVQILGNIGFTSASGTAPDVTIFRDGAPNTLALRNGTNAQTFRVYGTTSGGNSSFLSFYADPTGYTSINNDTTGSGTFGSMFIVANAIRFQTGTSYAGRTARWQINDSGHFIAETDNTYDIGASGTTSRVRTIYSGGGYSAASPTIKTANYTQLEADYSLIFNGTGSITLTLLAAATYPGKILYVKTIAAQTVVSASSNVKPIDTNTAGTAILAATAGKWAMLQSDGTNWVIMAQG